MRKTLLSLALFVMTVMTAMAQITTVTFGGSTYDVVANETLNHRELPGVAYSGNTADFSAQLATLASAVGLESVSTGQFVQVDPTGAGFAYNTNDGWHAADGTIEGKTWGSEEKLVCVKPWNVETNVIDGTIGYIGCIDDTWTEGEVHTCYAAVINDGKAGLLTIQISFSAYPFKAVTFGGNTYELVANETLSIEEVPGVAYSGSTADFSAQLATLASAVGLEAVSTDQFVQVDPTSAGFAYNTNDGWHAADGTIEGKTWGSEEKLVCVKPWNVETNVIDGTIGYIGCIDDTWTEGEVHTCYAAVINDGKAALLTIEITFAKEKEPEPEPEPIADPVTHFSELEIVKKYEATLELIQGQSYEAKYFDIEMSDLAEVLGCDTLAIIDNIEKITVARMFINDENNGIYEFSDSLVNHRTPTDGWFGRYKGFDELTGTEYAIEENAFMSWGSSCTVYLQSPKYSNGVYSIKYGQYGNLLMAGDTDFITLYIVNGNKAAELVIRLNITAPITPESSILANLENVGKEVVEVTATVDNNYATKPFSIDIDKVYESLGCEAKDIIDIFACETEGELSDNHTEGSGGFYFNEEGLISGWGSSSCAFIALGSIANGEYTIGQMANHYTDITEPSTVIFPFYYTYNGKYYTIEVHYTVKPESKGDDPVVYTCVDKAIIEKLLVPTTGNNYNNGTSPLDLEYIESKIGTTDFTLYTDVHKTADDVTTLEWSKNYTCSPAPGFWYGTTTYENAEHQVVVDNAGWGTNSFGITYASGTLTWYTYPGQRSAGDEYLAHLYIVNEENGNYIDYAILVSYVDSIGNGNVETVAQSNIAYGVTAEDIENSVAYIDLDIASIMENLGLESEDEIEAAEQTVQATSVTYKTASLGEAFCFDAQGKVVSDADENLEIMSYLTTADEDGEALDHLKLFVAFIGEALDFTNIETSISYKVGIVYNNKRMMFNVTLANPESEVVGIKNTTTSNASAIYTVAGTKASSLQKGINIVVENGKAKKILK